MMPNSLHDERLVRRLPLLIFCSFLVADSFIVLWYGYHDWPEPWLRILGEKNAMTWLSSLQLAFCGWLAFAIAVLQQLFRGRLYDMAAWVVVGSGFLYLAVDEWMEIHERVVLPFSLFGLPRDEGLLLLIGVVLGLFVGPSLWRQLRSKPRLLAGFLLAFGMAVLSQTIDSLVGQGGTVAGFWSKMTEVAEEACEMAAEAGFASSLAAIGSHHLLTGLRRSSQPWQPGHPGRSALDRLRAEGDAQKGQQGRRTQTKYAFWREAVMFAFGHQPARVRLGFKLRDTESL